jgi:hypothetical protein
LHQRRMKLHAQRGPQSGLKPTLDFFSEHLVNGCER